MTGPRLIGRLEAERLEKPATTSKTPQNAQTSLVVGLPGGLVCCNKETGRTGEARLQSQPSLRVCGPETWQDGRGGLAVPPAQAQAIGNCCREQ